MIVYRTAASAELAAVRSNPEGAFTDLATRTVWMRDPISRALGRVYPVPHRIRDPRTRAMTVGWSWRIGA
jgi:hypothetical protein